MKGLLELSKKESCLAIGLMSGTSLDGIDAALTRITGSGTQTKAQLLAFTTTPFSKELREKLLVTVLGKEGGSYELSQLNALIGQLSAQACLDVCKAGGVDPSEIDFVGSHGQTVYHQPQAVPFAGQMIRSTLQIGEAAEIAQVMNCIVVADFRVRDFAAEGQGAPLVPYTEYLLYQEEGTCVALQNLGGIGNITILPPGGNLGDVVAFDTGPGNMLIDGAMAHVTAGAKTFDEGGAFAQKGSINQELAAYLMKLDEGYLNLAPPKSTGREYYNDTYLNKVFEKQKQLKLKNEDLVATLTNHTGACIAYGIEKFAPVKPEKLIIGGGGSYNKTLVSMIQKALPGVKVLTQEEMGLSSEGKEAVAFAVLANEAIKGHSNNAPSATGAKEPVIMGKISF